MFVLVWSNLTELKRLVEFFICINWLEYNYILAQDKDNYCVLGGLKINYSRCKYPYCRLPIFQTYICNGYPLIQTDSVYNDFERAAMVRP